MDSPRREYIDRVLKQVHFRHDHGEIRRELDEHIEDLLEAVEPEDEAACIAEHMGDAEELGKALNKEHNPVLGWIWLLARRLCIAMAVLLLLPTLNLVFSGVGTGIDLLRGYRDNDFHGAVVERMDAKAAGKVYEVNIRVDELVLYEDGTLEMRYRTWQDPFGKGHPWSFSLGNCFYDDLGNQYFGGGYSGGGWVSLHQADLDGFDPAASAVVINYDYSGGHFYAEIPLEWRQTA